MAAFIYGKKKPNLKAFTQKDYTIISKAIKFLMQPYEDDEHNQKEFELSAKERHLLAQLRTTLKKITEIRKANR